MPTTLDIRGTQIQVFTHADAVARGHSRRTIDRNVASGNWVRLVKGAYAYTPAPNTGNKMYPEDLHLIRVAAMVLNAEPGWYASSWSSLVAHGLPLVGRPPHRVHITHDARMSKTRRSHSSVRRERSLAEVATSRPQGIPALEVCDSLVEYATQATFTSAVTCADAALHRKFTTLEQLTAAAAATSRHGARAARAMAAFADPRAESPGESRLRILVHELGLVSTPQFPIHDDGGPARHRADLHVRFPSTSTRGRCGITETPAPTDGLLLEFDGKMKFDASTDTSSTWTQFDHQRARDQRLAILGYRVMHVTWSDLAHPALLKRQIMARLASTA